MGEGSTACSHVDDAAGVKEVQALGHTERHGLPLVVPIEVVTAFLLLPEQCTAEVAALRGQAPKEYYPPTLQKP